MIRELGGFWRVVGWDSWALQVGLAGGTADTAVVLTEIDNLIGKEAILRNTHT
jgi:hypothetical protein